MHEVGVNFQVWVIFSHHKDAYLLGVKNTGVPLAAIQKKLAL